MTKAISIFSCANELHKIAIKRWRIVAFSQSEQLIPYLSPSPKNSSQVHFRGREYCDRGAKVMKLIFNNGFKVAELNPPSTTTNIRDYLLGTTGSGLAELRRIATS